MDSYPGVPGRITLAHGAAELAELFETATQEKDGSIMFDLVTVIAVVVAISVLLGLIIDRIQSRRDKKIQDKFDVRMVMEDYVRTHINQVKGRIDGVEEKSVEGYLDLKDRIDKSERDSVRVCHGLGKRCDKIEREGVQEYLQLKRRVSSLEDLVREKSEQIQEISEEVENFAEYMEDIRDRHVQNGGEIMKIIRAHVKTLNTYSKVLEGHTKAFQTYDSTLEDLYHGMRSHDSALNDLCTGVNNLRADLTADRGFSVGTRESLDDLRREFDRIHGLFRTQETILKGFTATFDETITRMDQKQEQYHPGQEFDRMEKEVQKDFTATLNEVAEKMDQEQEQYSQE